ncbi:MAG: ATP-binding cassette domain-containing protein, partial [Balneolaceae bacterium]
MLQFENVVKKFAKVRAVDELSFEIRKGEIFALLGPNGAGKTTGVRMIMQIMEPDSGSITFDPSIMKGGKVDRSKLGYLPEERGLYQDAPIMKTLIYLSTLRGSDPAEAEKKASEWLDRFGILDRQADKISTLSKGNQQKVQFIASILHEPDFVVLDEPFSGFDPINQERISDCIRELRESGMTILLSAHQMQLVERIADRILLINNGREL